MTIIKQDRSQPVYLDITGWLTFFMLVVMRNTFTLSEVPLVQVERISTGFEFLDLCYGKTMYGHKVIAGLPVGAVSLWSGSPGVGKTRVGIAVCVSANRLGHRVMFIQNEVTPEQFRQWTANQVSFPDEFLIHTTSDLDKQIADVMAFRPHIIVVDSLNMIPHYQSSDVIRDIAKSYKEVVQEIQGHVILISHLNKAGVVKGNNDIQYMVDVECTIEKYEDVLAREYTRKQLAIGDYPQDRVTKTDIPRTFILTFIKNRYGPTSVGGTENFVCFRHIGDGIEVVTSNFDNPKWCNEDAPVAIEKKSRRWLFWR